MKLNFLKIALCVFPVLFGSGQNVVLMVDQDGQLNYTNVLATAAQMSSNLTAVAIADAKADAAISAAAAGSNMVEEVVTQITENQLVVYREGFIDSFSSDVGLPPDAKMVVSGFTPNVGGDAANDFHEIKYAVTHDASSLQPDVLYAETLSGGRDAMLPLEESKIGVAEQLDEVFTSSAGVTYPFVYKVRFAAPKSSSGFYCVYLSGEDSAGSSVLEITGGVTGGKSATFDWGGNRLIFTGGILTGVEEIAQ